MDYQSLSKSVMESVDDGVILIGRDKKITIFNPAAERFSGYEATTVMDKDFETVIKFDIDDSQAPGEKINLVLGGELQSGLYYQATVANPKGDLNPIIYKLVPVTEGEKIVGCLFVFRDHKLDRMKIDILSIVAHQLKTPLGSMRWNLEGLMESDTVGTSAEIAEVVRDVYSANSRLIALVDDLINASRIDQRKVSNKPEMVKVKEVVEATIKELDFQAQQKRVGLTVNLTSLTPVMIDPKRLREVLQNLISNAIKYNRVNGNITIDDKFDGEKIEISIRDTGIGIPETDLPKIFSRSFRAKNAMESEIDGSGLGLFVAKSFVEDWGGIISCKSQVGQGTVIAFTIPLQSKESQLNKNITGFIN